MTGMYDDSILFALIGIIITVGGVIFQYKNKASKESEMQKQSMLSVSQDPMVVHVNVIQPQIAYQQPYGAPVYPPVQGYQQQPQQPAYAQLPTNANNDSSSADYHQVNN